MTLSLHNEQHLGFLKDIYEVSRASATVTYIWGGLAIDILEARFQLDYTLKTNIRMTHATWDLREKDHVAIAYLEKAMTARDIDPEDFLRRVWSYNPYWAKRGYPDYAMPAVARPLHPLDSDEA